jgi:hypothetical protein
MTGTIDDIEIKNIRTEFPKMSVARTIVGHGTPDISTIKKIVHDLISKQDLRSAMIKDIDDCRTAVGFLNTWPRKDIYCSKKGRCRGCHRLMRFGNIKEKDLK